MKSDHVGWAGSILIIFVIILAFAASCDLEPPASPIPTPVSPIATPVSPLPTPAPRGIIARAANDNGVIEIYCDVVGFDGSPMVRMVFEFASGSENDN